MSTKLPPKQTTRIFESSPTLKTEANFRNFVDIFSNVGFRFDPVRTHPIGSERFDYVVSHTKTHIGLLTRIVISAGSLSGFFPRIEGDNQLVALICVLKGTLTITQRSETRQFKRDDFIIADPHLAMTIFAKKPASFFSFWSRKTTSTLMQGLERHLFMVVAFTPNQKYRLCLPMFYPLLANKLRKLTHEMLGICATVYFVFCGQCLRSFLAFSMQDFNAMRTLFVPVLLT